MGASDFWDDADAAQKIISEMKLIKAQTSPVKDAADELEEAKVTYELAKEAGDDELLVEADEQLFNLQQTMDALEVRSLLSGKHDHRDCFMTISAGDGGTEANDWAEMLFRMFIRWSERHGMTVDVLDTTEGEEPENPESRRWLVDLLRSLVGAEGEVEVYSCWSGDEALEVEERKQLHPDDFNDVAAVGQGTFAVVSNHAA